jgi:hypothetical protein
MPSVELTRTPAKPRDTTRTLKGQFVKRNGAPIQLTVTKRRQTPEENRHYITAYKLLVAELIGNELRRMGKQS